LFQGSRAWVYHEAIVWGAALALAAVDQLLAHVTTGRRAPLVRASAFTAGSLLARVSVGLGPLAGLGLVAALALARRRPAAERLRAAAPAALATAVPLAAYAGVNWA